MAKRMTNAKRANRPNPRADRNPNFFEENILDFPSRQTRRARNRDQQNQAGQVQETKAKKVVLLPRNLAQETYLETLQDETKAIVFAMGPAGTGKTMLATQYAISLLQAGEIDKIIITRPAVSVDEQHGFLPGTLVEKLAPWVVPIIDVFKEHYSVKTVERMLAEEIIEISPLAFMRGRTFKSSYVIADECQNATISQMKMLLTRIGEGSRMVVTGDLKQHDRGFSDNGLKDFVARLKQNRSNLISVCEFGQGDVERHAAVAEVLRIYGED